MPLTVFEADEHFLDFPARSLVEEGVHSIQTLQKAYPVVVLKKKNKAKKDNKAALSGLVQLQHHHHHQRIGSSKLQKRTTTAAAAAYGINSWSVRDISDMATKAGRGMRAVRVHEFGGPEVLKVEKVGMEIK